MSFVSVMKKIGQDVEKVFNSPEFQIGEKVASTVVSLAFPGLGNLFNVTAQAVMTAEANFASIGQQSGTGSQKLAAVITTAGNLVAQGLKDAGVSNVTQTTVSNYISAVVAVLNATPAPTSSSAIQGPPAAAPTAA